MNGVNTYEEMYECIIHMSTHVWMYTYEHTCMYECQILWMYTYEHTCMYECMVQTFICLNMMT